MIKDISRSINNKVNMIEVESTVDVIRLENELIAITVPLIFLSISDIMSELLIPTKKL